MNYLTNALRDLIASVVRFWNGEIIAPLASAFSFAGDYAIAMAIGAAILATIVGIWLSWTTIIFAVLQFMNGFASGESGGGDGGE